MPRPLVALAVLAVLLALTIPLTSHAAVKPFDAKSFAAAQDAGQGIVVMVHAPW
jgi:hypothetical protein